MATVALLASTWTTTAGSKSAAGTPAVGDLIVVGIGHTGNATSTSPTDDQSGTYTKLTSTTKGGGADLVELWVRDQLVTSAVSHTFTHNPGTTTGGGLIVFNASGCAAGGTGGIQQSGTKAQTAAGNTPTVPFGAAVSSVNPVIAFLVNQSNPAGVTPPTGYTEVLDTGYNTPAAGIEAVALNSGETGSAITWGSTSATIYCALAAELLAGGGAVTHAATGALTGQIGSVAGSAARTRQHASTGALTGPGSAVVGSAAHIAIHGSSGTLTGPGSSVTAAAARTRAHPSSGALTGQGSAVVGSATRLVAHAASGSLTGQLGSVSGSAARSHGAVSHGCSGALGGQASLITGEASIDLVARLDRRRRSWGPPVQWRRVR